VSSHACCKGVSSASSRVASGAPTASGRPLTQRCREAARWMVPGTILALLPKCPACLAAYIAIGSGIGVSITTATYVRMGVVILCVASLSYVALSRGGRFMAPNLLSARDKLTLKARFE